MAAGMNVSSGAGQRVHRQRLADRPEPWRPLPSPAPPENCPLLLIAPAAIALLVERLVSAAGLLEESRPLALFQLQRGMIQTARFSANARFPPTGSSLNSRRSQLLANFQSRSTVSSETFSTSAVSLRSDRRKSAAPRSGSCAGPLRPEPSGHHRWRPGRCRAPHSRQRFIELEWRHVAPALQRLAGTCPIHQNAPHHPRAHGEEMSPALPIRMR